MLLNCDPNAILVCDITGIIILCTLEILFDNPVTDLAKCYTNTGVQVFLSLNGDANV